MQGVIRVSGMSLLLAAVVALAACSSTGKTAATTDRPLTIAPLLSASAHVKN